MYVPDWLIVLLGCGLFAALLSLWKIAPKKNAIRGAKESPERLRAKRTGTDLSRFRGKRIA